MKGSAGTSLTRLAERYARRRFGGDPTGHDWFHIDRVRRTALAIAGTERADIDLLLVELAALLHEVGDWKLAASEDDSIWEELRSAGAGEALIRRVQQTVSQVSFKGAGVDTRPSTLEAMIVQDADRLDAIGAIGIARAFAYGGRKGQPLHDPDLPASLHDTFDAYRNHRGTTVNHFREKLLLLRDRMNTREGKRLAEARHRYMEAFLWTFENEWSGREPESRQLRVVAGGQTGVDRAALDTAIGLGLPVGGWCPKGRLAEDGPIPEAYPLTETPSEDPAQRTEWNVRDSDGTLILTRGALTGGTALTAEFARSQGRPLHLVDFEEAAEIGPVFEWMTSAGIAVLNVGGPRESGAPGIYAQSRSYLAELFIRWSTG